MGFGFTLVTNLPGAPCNGLRSAAAERHGGNTDAEPPLYWSRLFRDLLPVLLNEVRKFVYYLAWALPLLTLFVVPVVELFAPATWLLFSAWMMAIQYLDYPPRITICDSGSCGPCSGGSAGWAWAAVPR